MGKGRLEAFSDAIIAIIITILAIAVGNDFKGKISIVVYAIAVPLAFGNSWFACILYILVTLMWLIPDLRIEKTLTS
jgi:uncharacterized membrane protein